jgi:hypothetical protein
MGAVRPCDPFSRDGSTRTSTVGLGRCGFAVMGRDVLEEYPRPGDSLHFVGGSGQLIDLVNHFLSSR